MLVTIAVLTVKPAELRTEPAAAVIVVWPGARPVARALVLIVATDGVEEPQLTDAGTSCVLLSLNHPVAVSRGFAPAAMVGLPGATPIAERVAGVTVSTVEPLTEPAVAA